MYNERGFGTTPPRNSTSCKICTWFCYAIFIKANYNLYERRDAMLFHIKNA